MRAVVHADAETALSQRLIWDRQDSPVIPANLSFKSSGSLQVCLVSLFVLPVKLKTTKGGKVFFFFLFLSSFFFLPHSAPRRSSFISNSTSFVFPFFLASPTPLVCFSLASEEQRSSCRSSQLSRLFFPLEVPPSALPFVSRRRPCQPLGPLRALRNNHVIM